MVANNPPSDKQQADAADKIANTKSPKTVHKLPRSVRLSNEYVIRIKLVSAERMKEVSPDSDVLGGMWHDRTNTIYVLKEQSSDERWYYFRHELVHALNDVEHWIRMGFNTEESDDAQSKTSTPQREPVPQKAPDVPRGAAVALS